MSPELLDRLRAEAAHMLRRKTAIASELYKAFERIGADEHLLAIIGSWGDTIDDEQVLQYLKDWHAGKVMQERQC